MVGSLPSPTCFSHIIVVPPGGGGDNSPNPSLICMDFVFSVKRRGLDSNHNESAGGIKKGKEGRVGLGLEYFISYYLKGKKQIRLISITSFKI